VVFCVNGGRGAAALVRAAAAGVAPPVAAVTLVAVLVESPVAPSASLVLVLLVAPALLALQQVPALGLGERRRRKLGLTRVRSMLYDLRRCTGWRFYFSMLLTARCQGQRGAEDQGEGGIRSRHLSDV
jgi:hypothetical protein